MNGTTRSKGTIGREPRPESGLRQKYVPSNPAVTLRNARSLSKTDLGV
jgi:hypothetical protein